jgi:hypothetical protein
MDTTNLWHHCPADKTHWHVRSHDDNTNKHTPKRFDPTMLHILSTLASAQTIGTQEMMATMTNFLNYAATNPDAKL